MNSGGVNNEGIVRIFEIDAGVRIIVSELAESAAAAAAEWTRAMDSVHCNDLETAMRRIVEVQIILENFVPNQRTDVLAGVLEAARIVERVTEGPGGTPPE